MHLLLYLLVPLTCLGHLALWIGIFNRLHATALSCRWINALEKLIFLTILLLPLPIVWHGIETGTWIALPPSATVEWIVLVYLVPCWAMALGVVPVWLGQHIFRRDPAALLSNDTTTYDVAEQLGRRPLEGFSTRLLDRVPGNQILRLDVHEKTIALDRLSKNLDGLTIAHLSDLHYTGKLTRDYYEYLIDRTNELDADVVTITGDIVDKTQYIDWIAPTIGRLKSRFGVFSILGNHDKRVRDEGELRRVLGECGLVDLGGRWIETELRGETVVMAGNEMPWFTPAPDMQHAPPHDKTSAPLRILLSHSPDQFAWARSFDFDLMLAGHTHGGQIRLPLVGPIVSPSYHGVQYASGTFHKEPTLMHVTRGISGLHPIRINCPPELTKLVLRRG